MMKKAAETIFVCSNCGNEFSKWQGQCSACKEWNTLKEVKSLSSSSSLSRKRIGGRAEVINLEKLEKISQKSTSILPTQIVEFDRVLGKGIVRGQTILFAGEPGIGKSTLLTQLLGKIGGLYVAGEESAEQILLRVERLGLQKSNFRVLETNDIDSAIEVIERVKDVCKVVVVDSIQVMSTGDIAGGGLLRQGYGGQAGSVAQVRECAFRLIETAKRTGVAIIIVGHVTKEGEIAGPKLLEHMVDTVVYFEGEKSSDLRILRCNKNRFGPTDEVGIFKMSDIGLSDVRNNLDLTGGNEAKVGSAVTIIMEGTRPMMVEIQALVTESFAPMPKRVFSGIDYNRGQLLVAVVQKVLGVPMYKYDVFVAVTGGLRIEDTGVDAAVVGAMYSSYKNKPITKSPSSRSGGTLSPLKKGEQERGFVLIGEVSLLGEVKKVKGWEKRVKEADGLGREVVIINSIRELKAMI